MSTLAQDIELIVSYIEDCKKALAEKNLEVQGDFALCIMDKYIEQVGLRSKYSWEISKHNISDYNIFLYARLDSIKSNLIDKGVEITGSLKISQIASKIREIPLDRTIGSARDLFKEYSTIPKNIEFTDEKAPSSATVYDWSLNKDKSVVKWYDSSSDTLYISSQTKGMTISEEYRYPKLPVSTYKLFSTISGKTGNNRTEKITINKADLSQVTNMSSMFEECTALKFVLMSGYNGYNTIKRNLEIVTDMSRMFYNCTSLRQVDTFEWIVRDLTTTKQMFKNTGEVSFSMITWDFPNLTNAEEMFRGSKTKTIPLTECTFPKLRYLDYMFADCVNLGSIVARWDWQSNSNIVNTAHVFDGSTKLRYFNASRVSGKQCYVGSQGYFT